MRISTAQASPVGACKRYTSLPCIHTAAACSHSAGGGACLRAAYVVVKWVLGGFVNTSSYMVAPSCVAAHHKAAANGLLAITYQSAHCTGLIVATVVAAALFGGFGPL